MDSSETGDNLTSAERDLLAASRGVLPDDVTARRQVPFGVALVVVVSVLVGLLNAFLALNAWIRAAELREPQGLSIVFLVEALVGIALAVGLWRLREWARIGAIVLYGLSFVINFVTRFNEPLTAGSLMGLVIPAAIVIYLIQPQVAENFA